MGNQYSDSEQGMRFSLSINVKEGGEEKMHDATSSSYRSFTGFIGPVLLGVGEFLCGISNGGRARALDLKITHEAKDLEGIY